MPRLLDTGSRTDDLADVMARLIAERGLAPPSTRSIARRLGISVGTLAHHYERRRRLVEILAWTIVRRFAEDREVRTRLHGPAGLLPDPTREESLLLTRAWLAVQELARASDHVAGSVQAAEEQELMLLDQLRGAPEWPSYALRLARRPAPDRRPGGDPWQGRGDETTLALLTGLRTRVCARLDPLPVGHAVELLRRHLGEGRPAAPPAA